MCTFPLLIERKECVVAIIPVSLPTFFILFSFIFRLFADTMFLPSNLCKFSNAFPKSNRKNKVKKEERKKWRETNGKEIWKLKRNEFLKKRMLNTFSYFVQVKLNVMWHCAAERILLSLATSLQLFAAISTFILFWMDAERCSHE